MHEEIITHSVEETRALGARRAVSALSGSIFSLNGDLGCGKTEFVRGFVKALAPLVRVSSPSFPLLNIYETEKFPVYHFDWYRLADAAELREIGFDEYVQSDGILLIEWADLFPEALPKHTIRCTFEDVGENQRHIIIGS